MNALLAEFHFLRPLWLLLLLLLPLLLWRWRRSSERADPWRAVCDPDLLQHLRTRVDGATRRLAPWLFGVAWTLAVLALAGPAWRQLPQPLVRSDTALVIALDLSDRMRAADLKPDRLSRARFKIADLLASRREGQTALIAYAGDAFTVAPLTDDAASLSDLLASLTPETMPVRGQRAERAIALAARLVRDAGFAQGDLLLVTDRVPPAAARAASEARAAGLRTSVLGVGTEQGAPVTLAQGGFVKDQDGNLLLPRLEEAGLRDLAAAGDGRYVRMDVGRADLDALDFGADIAASDDAVEATDRTRAQYQDEGPWLLLILVPLAALAFRRGWLMSLLWVVLALPPAPAQALDWEALWRREDQRAWRALEEGDAARAAELAQDPALRGSAAYRANDFARAQTEFARGDDATAHYNRGNALARAQRFEEALGAYDEALRRDPQMQDARANRDAVEQWMKQQQSQSTPSPGESSQPQQGQDDATPSPSEADADAAQQQTPSGSEQQPADARQQSGESNGSDADAEAGQDEAQQRAEAEREFNQQMQQALEQQDQPGEGEARAVDPREAERQQAVEQWLRRVPDDPGGLLRRKFALEYQRRLRDQDGEGE